MLHLLCLTHSAAIKRPALFLRKGMRRASACPSKRPLFGVDPEAMHESSAPQGKEMQAGCETLSDPPESGTGGGNKPEQNLEALVLHA